MIPDDLSDLLDASRKRIRREEHSRRPGAFTVLEFCQAFGISVALLYKLWAQGQGPDRMMVGSRTLISEVAADKWRQECEKPRERKFGRPRKQTAQIAAT